MPSSEALWTTEKIVSAVIPLVVALLNLLVAGYALIGGLRERRKLAFAAGAAGVGIWALAWFISVFNPSALSSMRWLGTAGGLLAIFGFAVDVLVELPRRRAILLVLAWSALTLVAAGFVALAPFPYPGEAWRTGARVFAVVGVFVVGLARLSQRKEPVTSAAQAKIIAWSLGSIALTGLGFTILTAAAYFGERTFVDPMLFVVLLAELFALAYIMHRRIDVHVLVSRAVTYSVLAVVVAGIAAFVFQKLGYELDVVVVSVTVAVALMASALFMGVSDPLTRQVQRLIFPRHARMEAQLTASRGEMSALRRRLERAEKLAIAGELAASVAHEIKNPLAPIRGYAQLLSSRLESLPEAERAQFAKGLGIIRDETDRIDSRVAELLDLARADRTESSSQASMELNRVVIEAAAVAEGEPGLKKMVKDLDAELGRVAGAEDEIRGALLNLMKNAAEAMHTVGGTLRVETKRAGDQALVLIIDDGPGIEAEEPERVFQAFYTTKSGGTGLGLAIARTAVEAAGGRLSIRRREDQTGTVAEVYLPLRDEESIDERGRADRRGREEPPGADDRHAVGGLPVGAGRGDSG